MTHITIGAEKVSLEKPVVMGILNVTPDSFYDGGKYTSELKIMERVDEIVEQGAAIIDVAAYSPVRERRSWMLKRSCPG